MVAKDMAGIPVIGIDANFLAKAQADTTSNEATVLSEMQTAAEALHAGEKTYMMIPIAYTETGKDLFTFKLIGIDGGFTASINSDVYKK